MALEGGICQFAAQSRAWRQQVPTSMSICSASAGMRASPLSALACKAQGLRGERRAWDPAWWAAARRHGGGRAPGGELATKAQAPRGPTYWRPGEQTGSDTEAGGRARAAGVCARQGPTLSLGRGRRGGARQCECAACRATHSERAGLTHVFTRAHAHTHTHSPSPVPAASGPRCVSEVRLAHSRKQVTLHEGSGSLEGVPPSHGWRRASCPPAPTPPSPFTADGSLLAARGSPAMPTLRHRCAPWGGGGHGRSGPLQVPTLSAGWEGGALGPGSLSSPETAESL